MVSGNASLVRSQGCQANESGRYLRRLYPCRTYLSMFCRVGRQWLCRAPSGRRQEYVCLACTICSSSPLEAPMASSRSFEGRIEHQDQVPSSPLSLELRQGWVIFPSPALADLSGHGPLIKSQPGGLELTLWSRFPFAGGICGWPAEFASDEVTGGSRGTSIGTSEVPVA
jgi:hypothetical protein